MGSPGPNVGASSGQWPVAVCPMALLERLQGGQACFGGLGTINGAERLRDRLAIIPRREAHRVAEQVDITRLNDRLRECGADRFGEALPVVDGSNQYVGNAAFLELVLHARTLAVLVSRVTGRRPSAARRSCLAAGKAYSRNERSRAARI